MNKAIIFQNSQSVTIEFTAPCLLSDLLLPYQIPHPCAGKGNCRKCLVLVSGTISVSGQERTVTNEGCLCCQTLALGDVTITVPDSKRWHKVLPEREMSIKEPLGRNYGWVIDLGTTTVCVALYSLVSGKLCAEEIFSNPQSVFGADVISRIDAAIHGKAEQISKCIQDAIHKACDSILDTLGLKEENADACVLTGNTSMLYLLLGMDSTPLSGTPFECPTLFGDYFQTDFIPLASGTKTFIPRCISAFLGADILTASLASRLWDEGTHILADLGTNGEILLQKNGETFGCSCAVGPVFEGAGIECGMPAIDGAIDGVKLFGGQLIPSVIGGAEATGICGSGLIQLVQCLRKQQRMTPDGELSEPQVHLADTNIYVSQKDIRAFQLGKSAIRTGMETLMRMCDVDLPDTVELAGTFGAHLSIPAAQQLELLPDMPAERITAIGNAAASGAAMLLFDRKLIERSNEQANRIKTISLSEMQDFSENLMQYISF